MIKTKLLWMIVAIIALILHSYQGTQAQVYGSRCAVSAGVCYINPQPIGSVCYCGQLQGTTIQ